MKTSGIAIAACAFIVVGSLAVSESPAAPPSNDDCAGAIVIPAGPFPIVTPPVDAIEATPQGTDEGTVTCGATDYTVWYKFTPTVTTLYTITTCPADGATGNTALDTVIALYSSTGGSCPAVAELACNDSSICAISGGDWSVFSAVLDAGTTYFIVVGNWQPGGGLTPGNSTYQLHIEHAIVIPNDTCAGAVPIPINRIVQSSTEGANDDYRSPATAECFDGIGQTLTMSPGRDVVFTFTAPAAGSYNVRSVPAAVNGGLQGQDQTVYLADACPSAGGTVSCLPAGGANRETTPGVPTANGTSNNRGEEVHCFPMSAGQTVYVFFDDGGFENAGGVVSMEVTPCQNDEVEPNGSLATATQYVSLLCGDNEGASSFGPTAHCVSGTSPGVACTVHTGTANVNSDCGSVASGGLCFTDSVCIGGATPGSACVPKCVGGTNPGAVCTGVVAGQCAGGGTCATNGACGACVGGPTPGFACTLNSQCGSGGTCNAGTCDRTGNEGDVDFWRLGSLPAGSKVWSAIEASQSNDYDWRMRITSTTETLGFDDDDGHSFHGTLAPVLAGAVATGGDTFVKVSRTIGYASAPYRLYSVVTPPIGQAQAEIGDTYPAPNPFTTWPVDGLFAPYINNPNSAANGFISGTFGVVRDADCYQLLANEGDDIVMFGDSNPTRAEGATPGIPQLILYDAANAAIDNFVFTTGVVRATGPQTGNASLDALTPQNTSFFQHWRARYTGAFEVCAYPYANTNLPALGPYPKTYAALVTVNCQPPRAAGPGTTTTDVSISKSGPVGPVQTSSFVDYIITITNSAADIAQGVKLIDNLPSSVSFLGLTVDDGFGGNNTACASLPTPGTADAPIDCTNISMAPGTTTTYTVNVQVNGCLGDGIPIDNTATISTVSTDPVPANNSASWSFSTSEDGTCADLLCDATGCVPDNCTVDDHCEGSVCVTVPRDCDDNNVCTRDTCDNASGTCVNDPTPGYGCDDENPCTAPFCDPIDFCVFPPRPAGVPCDDFNTCTANDACDGQGNCAGQTPCDDGDPCTMEITDPSNGCACSHAPNPGERCSDGDPCTEGDHCDGSYHCIVGQPIPTPQEMHWLIWLDDKATLTWEQLNYATSYEVVRGLTSALPVGPANGDELCVGPVGGDLVDGTAPATGTTFWYLVRGANSCAGAGTYGDQSDGTPRVTTTCP